MPIRVCSLHVYPIKGCAPVDVDAIEIDADGLIVGDRSAMIVRAEDGRFLSQRQLPQMARVRATWRTPTSLAIAIEGHGGTLAAAEDAMTREVSVWDDRFLASDAGDPVAAWLSDWLGVAVRLVFLKRPTGRSVDPNWTDGHATATSFADLAPALLTNVASLDDLNARRRATGLGEIPMSRFRPNIVVEGADAFAEDDWRQLHVASHGLTLRCIKPCARCQVIEIDQAAGEARADHVLKSLASFRTLVNARGTRGIMFGQNVTFAAAGPFRLERRSALEAAGPPNPTRR